MVKKHLKTNKEINPLSADLLPEDCTKLQEWGKQWLL